MSSSLCCVWIFRNLTPKNFSPGEFQQKLNKTFLNPVFGFNLLIPNTIYLNFYSFSKQARHRQTFFLKTEVTKHTELSKIPTLKSRLWSPCSFCCILWIQGSVSAWKCLWSCFTLLCVIFNLSESESMTSSWSYVNILRTHQKLITNYKQNMIVHESSKMGNKMGRMSIHWIFKLMVSISTSSNACKGSIIKEARAGERATMLFSIFHILKF